MRRAGPGASKTPSRGHQRPARVGCGSGVRGSHPGAPRVDSEGRKGTLGHGVGQRTRPGQRRVGGRNPDLRGANVVPSCLFSLSLLPTKSPSPPAVRLGRSQPAAAGAWGDAPERGGGVM